MKTPALIMDSALHGMKRNMLTKSLTTPERRQPLPLPWPLWVSVCRRLWGRWRRSGRCRWRQTGACWSEGSPDWRERRPFGDYCPGPRRGWYGARKAVKSAQEARKILEEYFAADDLRVGKIKERETFFEAEIFDKENVLIDRIIVEKRNGRIRSIN